MINLGLTESDPLVIITIHFQPQGGFPAEEVYLFNILMLFGFRLRRIA
jgi:hypothetical protein